MVIPAKLKKDLRQQLGDYGITEHFIFPDVDGVARHINADTELMIERNLHNKLAHPTADNVSI